MFSDGKFARRAAIHGGEMVTVQRCGLRGSLCHLTDCATPLTLMLGQRSAGLSGLGLGAVLVGVPPLQRAFLQRLRGQAVNGQSCRRPFVVR